MNTDTATIALLFAIGPITAGLFWIACRAIRACRARREAREQTRARYNALFLRRRLRLI